ncbi:uncharacterized protein N7496_006574 [Penicillium cataractarum]|uniref:DDE-1 domain-containing protein n=1 Tax=Penicillium cataractarum TaxID=2100454 RepID=A0A9W9V6F6_9EURO|nr:uncharacterized protein N7496_006574 [Penicillium cataractarum]KAJ5370482.1 hypothetical protein N7496_006574 [Penicillium cataractarum]
MPKGPSTPPGRVSKTSMKPKSFTASNIVALKREISTSTPQPLQEVNNPPPVRSLVKALATHLMASKKTRCASQLHKRDGNTTILKQSWTSQFVKRLPDDLKPSKRLQAKKRRLDSSDLETVQHWFDHLKPLIADIPPANIYNFDETNFQIGLTTRPRLYIGRRGDPYPSIREWCEWITSIECIASDGRDAGSYLVIQESAIIDEELDYQYVIDDIPDFTELHETPNGRLTEELALGWLERFHKRTKDRVADSESRLLLFKGQPFFLTFNFLRFCEAHRIIPFCFPLNIAHHMQPFDLEHFSIYKKYGPDCFIPPEDPDEEKMWWLTTFGSACEVTLTPDIIKRAFADRGIYPFDPSKLTQPLEEEKNQKLAVEEDSE